MYPPGSTFKPVVAAAGWQTGVITPSSRVYCTGSYHLGRARFGCWETHDETDFTKAIAESCDVFFYVYGQKIGPDRISFYAKQFGLAEKTGIDLGGEDIGSIPSPSWKLKHFHRLGPEFDQWYGGDTLHMSIGQGDVLTTPLQMARVAATLANGGNVLQPYVVSEVTDAGSHQVVYRATPKKVRQISVSPANLERVRMAMRGDGYRRHGQSRQVPRRRRRRQDRLRADLRQRQNAWLVHLLRAVLPSDHCDGRDCRAWRSWRRHRRQSLPGHAGSLFSPQGHRRSVGQKRLRNIMLYELRHYDIGSSRGLEQSRAAVRRPHPANLEPPRH